MNSQEQLSKWIAEAIFDHQKSDEKKRKSQIPVVVELYKRLSQEKNPSKINYELLLVKKISVWQPVLHWDGTQHVQRLDSKGQPRYSFIVELDEHSTFTLNNISQHTAPLPKSMTMDTIDFRPMPQRDAATRQAEGMSISTESEPYLWDLVVRVVDGCPGTSDQSIIASVVIKPESTWETVETNLSYLKSKIDEYTATLL